MRDAPGTSEPHGRVTVAGSRGSRAARIAGPTGAGPAADRIDAKLVTGGGDRGGSERSPSPTSNASLARPAAGIEQATAGDQLGHLRAATARFQNIQVATDAGYTIELTGCMENASLGGMGYHFGKGSAINNPTPDPLAPEALLYEPQENGRYRLVGLEFIIPYTLTLLPRSSTPPTLFGQQFKQNDVFQVWALHAWIWRNNPSGIFADWNPTVDCAAAPTAARMSHGGH